MKIYLNFQFTLSLLLSLLTSMLISGYTPTAAQNVTKPEQDKKSDDLITCPAHVVFVGVVVLDEAGNVVTNLSKDDFKVYEAGVEQVVDFWERKKILANDQPSTQYKIGYYPIIKQQTDGPRSIKVEVLRKGKEKYKVEIVGMEESGKES